jgi:ADP-ribose pyrophosphatase YjhB (NUDIX family)
MATQFVDSIPDGELIGTAVILIDKWTNQIYLSKRLGEYETGKYCVPGGMVEENEDFQTAACREIKEETGLNLKFPDVKFLTITKHEGGKSNYTVWFKYYLGSSDIPKNTEPLKHEEWILYSKDQALKLPLMLSTKEVINKHL